MIYAPGNNDEFRFLFTGRTNDLKELVKYIKADNCVALFAERRGGKTLTLLIIQDIINGTISAYQEKLIDKNFKNQLDSLSKNFKSYRALYFSLSGSTNQDELVNRIAKEATKIGFSFRTQIQNIKNVLVSHSIEDQISNQIAENIKKITYPYNLLGTKLGDFLDELHKWIKSQNQKLVCLVDEMEILESFKIEGEAAAISQFFCDRERFPRIIFVYAGSHLWKNRIKNAGSHYNNVIHYYLKSINENDTKKYLISPIKQIILDKDENLVNKIATYSGCKPYYTQFICNLIIDKKDEIFDQNNELKETIILNDPTFRDRVSTCIYHEERVKDNTSRILFHLAKFPNSSRSEIANSLNIREKSIENSIENLLYFDTIYKNEQKKYRIKGTLIERLGSEIYSREPNIEENRKIVRPYWRWAVMLLFILLAIGLYIYSNPSKTSKIFEFNKVIISLDLRESVEFDETGTIFIAVQNKSNIMIDSLIISFESKFIRYDYNNNTWLLFKNIYPNTSANGTIQYWIRSTTEKNLLSTIRIVNSSESIKYEINKRSYPIRRLSDFLIAIFTIIGLIFPGRSWFDILMAVPESLKKLTGRANT